MSIQEQVTKQIAQSVLNTIEKLTQEDKAKFASIVLTKEVPAIDSNLLIQLLTAQGLTDHSIEVTDNGTRYNFTF